MKTKLLSCFSLLFLFADASAGQTTVIRGTDSRNHKVCIAKRQYPDGLINFIFYDKVNKVEKGAVLSREDAEGLDNVSIVASWNGDGSAVALLLYYSVKRNRIDLFNADHNGRFHEIDFEMPDPEKLYYAQQAEASPEQSTVRIDANALGPWKDSRAVFLVAGEAEDVEHGFCFLATYKVRIEGSHGTIQNVRCLGKLREAETEAFFEKWGERYWTGQP